MVPFDKSLKRNRILSWNVFLCNPLELDIPIPQKNNSDFLLNKNNIIKVGSQNKLPITIILL